MESGVVGFCVKPIEFGSTETKKVSFFRTLLLLILTINQRRIKKAFWNLILVVQVALYILDKIMSTDQGLYYCCVLA